MSRMINIISCKIKCLGVKAHTTVEDKIRGLHIENVRFKRLIGKKEKRKSSVFLLSSLRKYIQYKIEFK